MADPEGFSLAAEPVDSFEPPKTGFAGQRPILVRRRVQRIRSVLT